MAAGRDRAPVPRRAGREGSLSAPPMLVLPLERREESGPGYRNDSLKSALQTANAGKNARRKYRTST
ncbi:hypothetical protein NDU88_002410 [Pleurodeles waltl]|uniref:Uncharacterized protein n=1 Tax=Pleurodeles waltl TaxID=8319 RepID=A0AAV7T2T1_PLEWA|nr:hypothetical protein NDU88_002410 [Pleurodeles waltl]